ncbi:hypothetical protein AURDEDRAFT_176758 [Auricularia subglabra TFB-10046 SS5]|uniref:Uncharacterized protein n=1 Tax=Auricularia subglabra (strain TFB-10046 / SS5) TaxID=717982 RepID=J0WP63_AURST|nr:hypothetical protein AURDEDRAFT_176758 [Auricularia subglabra TFB-10046 SS5]
MQIAEAVLHDAEGITYSSDGTSDRGHHFQAHLLNVKQQDGNAHTYTLGVKRQFSHTAQANFDTWIDRTGTIRALYKLSKCGCTEQRLTEYFLCLLSGGQGDHNSGEKKMFRIMEAAHSKAVLTQLGQEVLKLMPDWDHMSLVSTAIDEMIVSLGGSDVWASLSEEQQERHREDCLETLAHELGVKRFADLPPEKQASLRFFAWAGCAMHKELNSVVGGEQGMRAFWKSRGLPGPMKLHNKDNAAAAKSGNSAAKARADDVSQEGCAKMVTLLGNLVRNKDPKKGYQRNFMTYMRAKLHRKVQFPPIHQARFQSIGAAAGFTLLYLAILTTFIELMRDKKVKSIEFNHLEENIYNALHDPPTLFEAAVHALYHLATSQPYVQEARVSGKRAQDLGPLHARVKEHCRAIIADPDLFLATPSD